MLNQLRHDKLTLDVFIKQVIRIFQKNMKINNLKFKEITSAIHNQVSLNLFQDQNELFKSKTITSNRSKSQPKFQYSSAAYHNPNYTAASLRKRPPPQDCFFHLQNSLISYSECISEQQRKSISRQLGKLLSLLTQSNYSQTLEKWSQEEGELSKKFKNRLVHLVFYLIYNKLCSLSGERSVDKEIKNYVLCEYYSRKFNFREFTLSICTEIQSLYCFVKHYEKSRQYARKCLKLAVLLQDNYAESKAIQNLSILNYYQGRLSQEATGLLSSSEKRRIIENYNEEDEIPEVFNFQKQTQFETVPQFTIEKHNNFIENGVQGQNVKYFQNFYHDIVKGLPSKSQNIRQVINKVSQVGLVRKYFGKDNYITIRPECHIIKPTHQEQVLITHKKMSKPPHQQLLSLKKAKKRVISLLEYTIEAYQYHL